MDEIVTTKYISCACNATGHCADWGQNGLICFGACHAVALYKPKVKRLNIGKHRYRYSTQALVAQLISAWGRIKCEAAKVRNWERIKCEIKLRKLISVSNQPPKAGFVYNLNENVKPVSN